MDKDTGDKDIGDQDIGSASTGSLCISRRPGESVAIGDVTVTVTKIHGNKVYLRIVAPKDVRVLRPEYRPPEPPKESE